MDRIRNFWRNTVWNHPERPARLVFLLYVALFPGSLVSVAFNLVPPSDRWFGGVLMSIQGIALVLWLWHAIGRASLFPSLVVLIGSFLVEYIGATTDVPFGAYDYTTVLGYRIAHTVPLVILFAWIMVTYGAWYIAALLPILQARWTRAILTGAIVALFDLQIEPVAVIIHGYWQWQDVGPYYGVPLVNFLGWYVVGMVFSWITDPALLAAKRANASLLPILALSGSCVMFLVMNSVAGHWLAATFSVFSIGGLVWVMRVGSHR